MALADTAKLVVNLSLAGNFASSLGKAGKSLDTFDGKISQTSSRAYKAGQQIGTGIKNGARIAAVGVGLLVSQVALGLRSLVELEQAEAQTGAVLKSTGQAAGITGAEVTRLAEKFESLNAVVGDEFIRAGQNMLLTFTNIKGKAFEPTLKAVLDLNTAMGKGPEGLTKTAILVGKALNDPTKGLTALTRVGVSFSKEQIKRIKGLQKEGKLYEAQKIILKELNKEFGGSFAAQGGTTAGKVAKFNDAIEDLQRNLAEALLPALANVADELSTFLQDPAVVAGVKDLGQKIGGLFSKENIGKGAEVLGGFLRAARDAAPAIGAAAKVAGAVISTAVKLFNSLPPEIQSLAIGGLAVNKLTGGLVTNIAGGLISSVLKQLVSGVVNVNGGVVNVNGGIGGGVPGAAGGGMSKLLAIPIAGAIVAAAVPIGEAFAGALPAALKGADGLGRSESQTRITAALDKIVVNTRPRASDREHEGAGFRPNPAGAVPFAKPDRADAQKNAARIAAATDRTTTAVETMRGKIGTSLSQVSADTVAAGAAAKIAGVETKAAINVSAAVTAARLGVQTATTLISGFGTQGVVRSGSAGIIAAVRSIPRPQTFVTVNVSATHVTKSITTQERYGPGNGSSGQPTHGAGGH